MSGQARDLFRHAPVERDARAAPLELAGRLLERLDPLDALGLLVEQVLRRVDEVGVDNDDVGPKLLARLEPDSECPVPGRREENLGDGRVKADDRFGEFVVEDLEQR